ncbi:MAG: prevent-host-death family protein [Sphingobium sp.]|uniref:prevent-host-death family protein n=1 Tax=Sphingobium sp. TaxID=1912891 RepID=UPI000DB2A64C|nr:prevent-host-death family protein [Sphingobium sp.]PZU05729.1 MAG: prevent-host-death family protein [Sphingobium sp.]PZU77946.1 MAG: prevent-host-death family protein [Rhizobium sp.]
MATRVVDDTVSLTDFHKSPGVYVDQSQTRPVILTKHKRPFAAVVSAQWLEHAEAALATLHGNRRVYSEGTFPNDFAARLEASLPSEAELAAGQWDHDTSGTATPDG